jgi:hypothetical protein
LSNRFFQIFSEEETFGNEFTIFIANDEASNISLKNSGNPMGFLPSFLRRGYGKLELEY